MSGTNARAPVALVLSGGGARGAYQAGVIAGIFDALDGEPRAAPLFDLFVGASAGALNAAYLATHALDARLQIDGLVRLWTSLRLRRHLRPACHAPLAPMTRGRALLDPRPIEALIERAPHWARMHDAIERGVFSGVIVPALATTTGKTSMFAELRPGFPFRPWAPGARNRLVRTRLAPDHIMASAAIPLVWPARVIDGKAHCDGGLRMSAPLSPAIRAGYRKVVVITLKSSGAGDSDTDEDTSVPPAADDVGNPLFLAGKVLDGLLLDPIDHDIENAERLSDIVRTLDRVLPRPLRERVDDELRRTRGAPYAAVDMLVFSPSQPLPRIAVDALDRLTRRAPHGTATVLHELARRAAAEEADLASFLLLDRELTGPLIELGLHDARARRAEIRRFFFAEGEQHAA